LHWPLTWSLVSAIPAPANAPTIAGNLLTFDPACTDVALGPIALTVQVSDGQKTANCSFNVTVTNAPPTITCRPTSSPFWATWLVRK